ncbi:aminoglycoside phosphotransferase family protein [Actinacidiphila oryziradicis]|uniref:aminoglycoside phosphotransferase family protein n=1 Tax=Actinacidiphila oryziradicis TaxID=2571141 RepID=UPI0023F16552|nr:aminoglycoside phosphotransferase family protein [Actinacidiphila oryziradicis]MCW2869981.1 aminoglycoside phosphotransferase [Actinacidiphila oryziradicis]
MSGPPAAGVRMLWAAVPADVRAKAEARLGAPVVEAANQSGGFSPGVAARLRLADGRRAFVKAVSPAQNPESPGIYRDEVWISSALPPTAPAPRLLASFDEDGWVVLLFEDVEGRMPQEPWVPAELDRVLHALAELAESLTPTPVAAPPVAARLEESFRGWRRLVAARNGGADDLTGLDPWAVLRLDRLADLESGWPEALAGTTLTHCDLRADNLLLTPDGRVVVVDWPWACVAAPWFDLLGMLPSVAMRGGPDPEEVFTAHPVSKGADPAHVTCALAALTGMFLDGARQPPPPGLPTLRAFQQAQGDAALAWLKHRLRP